MTVSVNVLIVRSFIMRRGWVVCTHILSRVILLHLIPETRHTPQAAETDGSESKDKRGERRCLMIKQTAFIESFKCSAVTSPGTRPIGRL